MKFWSTQYQFFGNTLDLLSRFMCINHKTIITPLQANQTPLHLAAYQGHTAMCELLIAKGANVSALNDVSDCVTVNGERREGRGENWWLFYDGVIVDVVLRNFMRVVG